MKDIVIRNVREEDISTIADIQINGWKSAYIGIIDNSYLLSIDKKEKISKLHKNYMQNGFIVAEIDKVIVGFCRYIGNNSFSLEIEDADCEISALYVRPDLKYNGIGTKLFQYVVEEFKSQKKRKMILWCFKDNEPSKRFYEKMGGTIIDEKQTILGGKYYAEVCFSYNL